MTPKEKAQQLFDRFIDIIPANDKKDLMEFIKVDRAAAKQCALIAVDEILSASSIKLSEYDSCKFVYIDEYWQQVKTEIEKL